MLNLGWVLARVIALVGCALPMARLRGRVASRRTMKVNPRFGRCARLSILCVQVLVGLECCTAAQAAQAAQELSDDAVKAAYLYRFAGYVDWPEAAEPGKPFVIAIINSPAVARELKRLVPGHQINDRAVRVIEVSRVRDTAGAAILFLGARHAELLRAASSELAARSMLVVTDEEGGLDAGSSINFLNLDRRVRFEVSLTAANRAGLKISAQLLTIAVRVFGGTRQSRDARGMAPECVSWTDCVAVAGAFDPS